MERQERRRREIAKEEGADRGDNEEEGDRDQNELGNGVYFW